MTNQVLAGEGVGWLRVGRLKKLFEDESYRVMAVAKLNKTLDRKIGPDDHIDDVVSYRLSKIICYFQVSTVIQPIQMIIVHYKTGVEGDVENIANSYWWLGAQFSKSGIGRNGICISSE